MKFMKLGSKPDAFLVEGNSVRYVSSELETDITICVGEIQFYLHKFPLLSKSYKLQKLVSETPEEIQLTDFPGGPKGFEICVKFCYGVTVTLNPYNVVAARCAAEYLEMTEDMERGNLVFKIEVFLNSSILRSWKDSIIALQTAKFLLPWSENLKVVGRCIDSIASKTSVDPSLVTWSYTYNNRKLATSDQMIQLTVKMDTVPNDWWIEDICELDIDIYKRVMIAIKSKGRMDGNVIAEALKTYAMRWLPDSIDALVSEVHISRNKSLVETIICLLPSDKGISCSCNFMLKLLKVAIFIGADESSREDLIRSIGLKLDEASVTDLLIPSRSPQTTVYDIELVQRLVHEFATNERSGGNVKSSDKDKKNGSEFVLMHGSWLKVGKLVDEYLADIAQDPNLSVSKFIELVQLIPESARPVHDGLYGAIDIYLKEHKSLTKAERKSLCGLMDIKKLSPDASMHAAQNDQLPLRVVVQVLFFEQVKAAANIHALSQVNDRKDPHRNSEDNWSKAAPENRKSLRKRMDEMKIKEDEVATHGSLMRRGGKSRGGSAAQLLPSRSRRIFDKLWNVGKGFGNGENKSSETSSSTLSPTSMVQGKAKSSVSGSRHRRHSIS